jgi:hypothetical protein
VNERWAGTMRWHSDIVIAWQRHLNSTNMHLKSACIPRARPRIASGHWIFKCPILFQGIRKSEVVFKRSTWDRQIYCVIIDIISDLILYLATLN